MKKTQQRKITIAIIAILVLVSIVYISLNPSNQTIVSNENKAAIVDQLGLTIPNQTFVDTSTTTLKQAGYTVEYYEGEEVTVDLYRNLATHGYSLIVLRVHSAMHNLNPPLALFTSEINSTTKYREEQDNYRLMVGAFNYDVYKDNRTYFAITPKFIRQSMKGRFDNTIVIMMGCNGLMSYFEGNVRFQYKEMAKAFIEKGAKVYISWSGSVLGSHTDQATFRLLQNLITKRQTIGKAVVNTNEEVGLDPQHRSLLGFWPYEVGNDLIELKSFGVSGLITNVIETKKHDPG